MIKKISALTLLLSLFNINTAQAQTYTIAAAIAKSASIKSTIDFSNGNQCVEKNDRYRIIINNEYKLDKKKLIYEGIAQVGLMGLLDFAAKKTNNKVVKNVNRIFSGAYVGRYTYSTIRNYRIC